MLSKRSLKRNQVLIPKLLDNHGALLSGDTTVIDLSTAENQLLMKGLLSEFDHTFKTFNWSNNDLAYSEGVGGCSQVRGLIADLANAHFNPRLKVDKSHVVLGAGGCFALNALVGEICDPGDGILIAAPYWPGLDLSISVHNDAVPVIVQIPFDEFFGIQSIKYYEAALAASAIPVKGVIICNPHNPLGRNYPQETLQATLNFCSKNNIHLISDEVYALSQHTRLTQDNLTTGFVSALSLDTTHAKGLVHVLYSLSKDFGCNGVRLGAFISQDNRDIIMSGALSTHCQTSTMATIVAQKVILSPKNIEYVNTHGRELLESAYSLVATFMQKHGIEFIPAESGMYIFARLCPSPSMEAEKVFRSILKKNALVISAGTDYHLETPGWFRICYACEREKLENGLDRIAICVNEFRQTHIEESTTE
ncbi:uncharacterized protein G6M90_00g000290 [Metarhizium brunneum]|uniref:Aminotransferase class I/classII large domain-containing protein n=1 Tax=Metarhizium brunneum TaxID=500148 RepID=A0A7D5YPM4_9HYPO